MMRENVRQHRQPWFRMSLGSLVGLLVFLVGSAGTGYLYGKHTSVPFITAQSSSQPPSKGGFTLLAVNDVYRIEGVDEGHRGGLARLRSLRVELERTSPDLLFLHAGDLLFPSLLSRQYNGEQMIDVLNLLDGAPEAFDKRMLVTFGNHEFDKDKAADAAILARGLKASQFVWLGSNLGFASGDDGRPLVEAQNLVDHVILKSGGVRVGVFSLTTDVRVPDYISHIGAPETIARTMTAQLRRQGAEVVVALTHLSMTQDTAVLRALGPEGPDLIIGGHEHNKQTRKVTGRWVIKADADARTAMVVHVTPVPNSPPQVNYEFRELGPTGPVPDPQINARIAGWLARHDRDYCQQQLQLQPGCLNTALGRTQVTLVGEELEIRRYETNLGNWIADQALAAFAAQGAQVAFINAGSLRLNQDIPAGSTITRRHVEEIFAYPMPLKLLRIDGATLHKVVSHAIEDWTGNGWWLQISGFAYRHTPEAKPPMADHLTLLNARDPQGSRLIRDDEMLLAVTGEFLVHEATGQDGYTMLNATQVVPYTGAPIDLKELVIKALQASGAEGIAPKIEGRICNTQRVGACRVVTTAGK